MYCTVMVKQYIILGVIINIQHPVSISGGKLNTFNISFLLLQICSSGFSHFYFI